MKPCTAETKRIIWLSGISMIVLALAFRIIFFAVSVTNVPASSDEALSPLQAEQILEGHRPLLVMANTYQFPVESYLFVPFIRILPHNAFGARIIPFLLCLGVTVVSLILMKRIFPLELAWPGIILLLFPSAYLLMLFSACALPQHNSFMLLSCTALLLAVLQRGEKQKYPHLMVFLASMTAGLAFSNHLIAIPILVMVPAFLLTDKSWRAAATNIPFLIAGLAIGMAPYFLAIILLPGAYSSVTDVESFSAMMQKFWSPLMTCTLPRALGVNTCVFPGGHDVVVVMRKAEILFSISWIMIMVTATTTRLVAFVRDSIKKKWPVLTVHDLFIGASWICLLLFLPSKRSFSHTYRHLLIIVITFPFIIGYLYSRPNRVLRWLVGIYAVCLVILNAGTSVILINKWTADDFAKRQANTADLGPAIEYLTEQNIHYCHASYWAAYRITYETDGKILCSQPHNERLPHWHTPYKDTIDQATNVAYVLTKSIKYLKPKKFEEHMNIMKISSKKVKCGDFFIYHDFSSTDPLPASKLRQQPITSVTSSHNPDDARNLNDNDYDNPWTTHRTQDKDMWVQVSLPRPMTVDKIRLGFGRFFHDHAPEMQIDALVNNEWINLAKDVKGYLDKFHMINNHPVYGNSFQTIPVPSTTCSAVRFVITKPSPNFSWTICEIDLLGRPAEMQQGKTTILGEKEE